MVWNLIAKEYDTKHRHNLDFIGSREIKFLTTVNWKKKSVQDIGCGTGRLINFFFEQGASRVIACDPTKEMRDIAAQRNSKAEILADCSSVKTDVTVFCESLYTMNSKKTIIKKACDYSQEMVFVLLNKENFGGNYLLRDTGYYDGSISPREVQKICEEEGFVVKSKKGIVFFPIPLKIINFIGFLDDFYANSFPYQCRWVALHFVKKELMN